MNNEIVVRNKETAMAIINLLIEEEYVVMLSKEEDLYVINIEYSQFSNRNDVVFMDREEFESKFVRIEEDNF